MTSCEHNSKLRLEGLCKKCSEIKPYMVFRLGENGGYFWGPGAPEGMQGKPATWSKAMEEKKTYYTAESVKTSIAPVYEQYYAKLAIGQAPTWKCDQRTKDLFCLSQWIMDEMIKLKSSDEDRRDIQSFFNRKARAETDLYELAARGMNSFLDGKIERYRGR